MVSFLSWLRKQLTQQDRNLVARNITWVFRPVTWTYCKKRIIESLILISNCRSSLCWPKKSCNASYVGTGSPATSMHHASERVVLHLHLRHQSMGNAMGTSQAFQWSQRRIKKATYSGTHLDGRLAVCMMWRCSADLACTSHRPLGWNISNLHGTSLPLGSSYIFNFILSSLLWCWGDFTAAQHGQSIYRCTRT